MQRLDIPNLRVNRRFFVLVARTRNIRMRIGAISINSTMIMMMVLAYECNTRIVDWPIHVPFGCMYWIDSPTVCPIGSLEWVLPHVYRNRY